MIIYGLQKDGGLSLVDQKKTQKHTKSVDSEM